MGIDQTDKWEKEKTTLTNYKKLTINHHDIDILTFDNNYQILTIYCVKHDNRSYFTLNIITIYHSILLIYLNKFQIVLLW